MTENIIISKRAQDKEGYRRRYLLFKRARDGFKAYLEVSNIQQSNGILLPSYIGVSPKEGSGVFDPIRQLKCRYEFYRLDKRLFIDMADLEAKIKSVKPKILLLIHFFGFPDPNLFRIIELAEANGVLVIEDEAHSMLSDLVGGICGRLGSLAIFSFHKILPVDEGGALVLNRLDNNISYESLFNRQSIEIKFFEYDLLEIARARINNANFILKGMKNIHGGIDLLRDNIPPGVVPQSIPILLDVPRDIIYERMNEDGYGLVSLYHTLIPEISAAIYPDSHYVSKKIINIPVHQDLHERELSIMIDHLLQEISLF